MASEIVTRSAGSSNNAQPAQGVERDLDALLTVDEVAAILRVNKNWVYEHTRSRRLPPSERLPYIKIGKYLRFEARAVRAFLEKKCRT
jgi:excisionase family DNA binding protein